MKAKYNVFLLCLIFPMAYWGQWPTNCNEIIEVCGADDYQTYPQIVNTVSDEFIITWVDDRSGGAIIL